jgi:EipB-like
MRRTFLLSLLGAAMAVVGARVVAAGPAAEPPLPFVGQDAFYQLRLAAPGGSDVVAGSGRMGYEVIDACSGWAVRQRLEMTLIDGDGAVTHTISDYATWEAKDGLAFRFHTVDMTDGEVDDRLDGEAHLERQGGPGEVTYTAPKRTTMALPAGTMFPMWQTEAIIRAAQAGRRFITMPLFDGTGADGASLSSVAIDGWNPPQAEHDVAGAGRFPVLAPLPSTRVHVAFFNRKPDTMLPDFEIAMRYFSNGVADGLAMDFGDFTMQGRLAHLAILPSHC